MATVIKPEEMNEYREVLERLRDRLNGDVRQMADEALNNNAPDSSGSLSNLPLHMADIGTENFEQEFTLGLIENEQETLDLIHEALKRINAGSFGACEECGEAIARPRLRALPYTPYCIECARKRERGQ